MNNNGTYKTESASNDKDDGTDGGKSLRVFVLVSSCLVILVCCVLLLKWNYSSPGVTVTTDRGLFLTAENNNGGEEKRVLVNINTADIDQLTSLPGIGDTLALRIIEYRTEHGAFKSVEDIMQVNGIGQSKFNDIAQMITVDTEGQNEDTGS